MYPSNSQRHIAHRKGRFTSEEDKLRSNITKPSSLSVSSFISLFHLKSPRPRKSRHQLPCYIIQLKFAVFLTCFAFARLESINTDVLAYEAAPTRLLIR